MAQVFLDKEWEDKAIAKPIFLKKDGTWWHDETPITNDKVIAYFFSLIQKNEDEYWLVNEREKERLYIEDTPFLVKRVIFYEIDDKLHAELLLNNNMRLPFSAADFLVREDGEWIYEFFQTNANDIKMTARLLDRAKQDMVNECSPTENENIAQLKMHDRTIILPLN